MHFPIKSLCTALLSLALAGTAAAAGPVTYSFAGTVTDDPFGLAGSGAAITGSFSFDPAAFDAIADPATGSYASTGAAYGFSANVGGMLYAVTGGVSVNTANDIGGVDQFGVIAQDGALTLELFLQDASATALSGDGLPAAFPSLAGFDFRQFRLFADDAEFTGSLDAWTCSSGCTVAAVPEPSTTVLLSVCLGAMALVMNARRRRH